MNLTFCEKYNFNEKKRLDCLASTGLSEDDLSLAVQLQRLVVEPNLTELTAQFFQKLHLNEDASRIFSRGFRDDKLQHFLASYLTTLGVEFDQAAYFEQRLRMGIAHVNAGVNLVIFQVGYRILQQLLIDVVPKNAKNAGLLRTLILKMTTLDLIVATEVYLKYDKTANDLSSHDSPVTRGSVNHLLDDNRLNELLLTGLQPINANTSACIAIAMIDELEKIGNVYGNDTVDQVRKGVTARLLATLRPGDGVGIISGKGYLLVLSHTTVSIAEDICKRLMTSISQYPVSADNITIPVTISLVLSDVAPDVEHKTLIQRLEQQLTLNQSKGVNQLEMLNGVARS